MSLLASLPQELIWIIFAFAFLYGAIFGSFSSVLVSRIHSKKQWIFLGRSACPDCGHVLHIWDLFPIFSYALLRGKCRYCHKKIPITYFLLEISGWILAVIFAYTLLSRSQTHFWIHCCSWSDYYDAHLHTLWLSLLRNSWWNSHSSSSFSPLNVGCINSYLAYWLDISYTDEFSLW